MGVSPRASRLQLGRKPSAWLRTSSLTLSNAAGILATPTKERANGKRALGVARQVKGTQSHCQACMQAPVSVVLHEAGEETARERTDR